jgi:hypothetical protein
MLDIGTCRLRTHWNALTDDEKIIEFSMRAFLSSPIQISSQLDKATDFELAIYCNEEILAVNQDCKFYIARPILRVKEDNRYLDILERQLEDGNYAYAIFNLGEKEENIEITNENSVIRDLWAKENISSSDKMSLTIHPHTAKILKITNRASFN